MTEGGSHRRPLKVRQRRWAETVARRLSERKITPNQISLASIVFAAVGSGAFLVGGGLEGMWRWVTLLVAAAMIQGRLLCNLFDGMVAIEGGRSTPSGELYNDVPDRISDSVLFIALGYSLQSFESAIWLGWAAALLAVLTAYVRVLGSALAVSSDFRGPMAKQHRMAVLTLACLVSPIEMFWGESGVVLWLALVLVFVGSVVTCGRRLVGINSQLGRTEG